MIPDIHRQPDPQEASPVKSSLLAALLALLFCVQAQAQDAAPAPDAALPPPATTDGDPADDELGGEPGPGGHHRGPPWLKSMTPEQRKAMREKLKSMQPEERRAFLKTEREKWLATLGPEERKRVEERHAKRREKWESLSPEQKEKIKARRAEGHGPFGGRGPGGGRGAGPGRSQGGGRGPGGGPKGK